MPDGYAQNAGMLPKESHSYSKTLHRRNCSTIYGTPKKELAQKSIIFTRQYFFIYFWTGNEYREYFNKSTFPVV